MSAVDYDAVMNGLKAFQKNAVLHVAEQFYGAGAAEGSGRFLIADETGLGKSVVARGIVASAIRALENDDSVDEINIVYICSNRDLATQNLQRLNVTDNEGIAMATRLSLLAKEYSRIAQAGDEAVTPGAKPVNLISFTPGTSFSTSAWRQGNGEERALLVLLLDEILDQSEAEQYATRVMFRGTVASVSNFSQWYVQRLEETLGGSVDAKIRANFIGLARENGLLAKFQEVRDAVIAAEAHENVPVELREDARNLISDLRNALAKAGVRTLRPNLIILDEFQRFRAMLDPEQGGAAADLAGDLFNDENAKVVLLSATPYKPFTRSDDDDEDHYSDFLATVGFLTRHDASRVSEVEQALKAYRQSLVNLDGAEEAAQRVRDTLISVMSRSERPPLVEQRDLVTVDRVDVPVPTANDMGDWLALSELGTAANLPINLEYWKSVPYFANFMEGYQVARKLRDAAAGPQRGAIRQALKKTNSLRKQLVDQRGEIDPGNGPLRALVRETLDAGWWKLLWMPPSMPYLKPGRVYGSFAPGSVTKHVLFSAWSASPTAIASILSHEADRRMRGLGRAGVKPGTADAASQRLVYAQRNDQAAGLSTLALFWPHPHLLSYTDQLAAVREAGEQLDPEELVRTVAQRLPEGTNTEQAYQSFFGFPGAFSEDTADLVFLVEEEQHRASYEGRRTNIEAAQHIAREQAGQAGQATQAGHATHPLSHPDLARIAAFSPGSVAYRALKTIAGEQSSAAGIWRAAFTIAEGLRTLFNRPEAQALLDHLDEAPEQRLPYWRRVLDYCADGNLRAVLDEYIFQLWCETGQAEVTDEVLLRIARTVSASLGMRPVAYHAREANLEASTIAMMSRFAIRYGGGDRAPGESDATVARQSVARAAFNSPFAPFVLTSTSVGQEGIDFHWWSHSVVHWNLPSNPVDFEQREGRVNRFGGHAVRKNVASRHWVDVLQSADRCAWRAAFDAAQAAPNDLGEFSPWWVYPGDSRIQRVLVQYPLSRDIEKYERLKSDLALYRLTLGQPRQEDMIEALQRRNIDAEHVPTIELSPPSVDSPQPGCGVKSVS